MQKGQLLFAENNVDFLNARKEFLINNGYHIVTATNPAETRLALQENHIDMAILDIRLKNDHDENDFSGFDIAENVAPSVPKIILTDHANMENLRRALRPRVQGRGTALDLIAKNEGPESLLRAIEQALVRNVFVAHGRDDGALQITARFIEQLGLRPIVLREQTKSSRTLIELLEEHTNAVTFAIVIMTPDDVGKLRKDATHNEPRARQNVIFELGYVLGKLGRRRVCVLSKGTLTRPSNIEGVFTTPMDDGGSWRLAVAHEMEGAGLSVNFNNIK